MLSSWQLNLQTQCTQKKHKLLWVEVANLSVFELLLNMFDDATTIQALEGPLKQLRSNLAGSGHHSSYWN